MKKKAFACVLVLMMILSFIPMMGMNKAYALESTGNGTLDQFINDGRFTNGASWAWNKGPMIASFGSSGCCAYCADYVKYCYGINNPRSGASFTNTSEIRAGDVLTVGNQSNGTGHWFVCLKRSGNNLYVAEGNYGNKVRIGWNYTISGNKFAQDSRSFTAGYHYLDGTTQSSFTSYVDKIYGVSGGIYLRGWTFNNNNLTKSTQVHVYLDGTVGSGASSWAVEANVARTDVDKVYHVGAYHGFDTTITGISPGEHTVYLYANDQYRSEHAYIGAYKVNVSDPNADKKGPSYSDFHVGELREGAFTVMAKVTDSSGVKEVKYAIWTDKDGQDDIVWYQGNCTDNNNYYWARVNFSNHKGEKGKYTIHMYAYDNKGNLTNPGISYIFKENGPIVSDIKVSNISSSGYTVTCTVVDLLGVLRVQFPTWTEKNDQDDIVSDWGTSTKVRGTKNGDVYSFRVNTSDHNGETGNYKTHIWAYDILGNGTSVAVPTVNVHNHSLVKTSAKAATESREGNSEYWTCSICGKFFSDSAGKTEISKANTIIPKLTHSTSGDLQNLTDEDELPVVTISKLKAAKKAMTVKWKKVSKVNRGKITAIQIQYSKDKKFKKGVKNVKASKTATTKKIRKLTAKKKYYIRIRTYKNTKKATFYSSWSKVKSVKVR